MLQKQTSFLEQYLESAFTQLETFKGQELSETQKEYIKKLAADNYVDPEVVLSNSVKNMEMSMYLSKIIEMYIDKEAIMTGYGTLYKNQESYDSIICKLLAYFMDERKVVKKEMIKLIGSGVPKSDIRVKVLDQRQKVLKLLANSFYGAYAEKSFIFYNQDAAPSVNICGL